MNTVEFTFCDIAILELDNLPAAVVEGVAEVVYDFEGWHINAIGIYCWNEKTKKHELVPLDGAERSDVFLKVHGALTMDKSWRDAIDARVLEAIEDDLPMPQCVEAREYYGV